MTGQHRAIGVRPLVQDDVPHLERMERELFRDGAWSRDALTEEIGGPGRWYVGAVAPGGGDLLGYAGLWFDGFDAQVMTIGTATAAQRTGVGTLLLDALLDRAREAGAERVLLEVRVDNDPALRLYERAGFRRLSRRRGYYQPENVDAWTMSLALRERAAAPPSDTPTPTDEEPDA